MISFLVAAAGFGAVLYWLLVNMDRWVVPKPPRHPNRRRPTRDYPAHVHCVCGSTWTDTDSQLRDLADEYHAGHGGTWTL